MFDYLRKFNNLSNELKNKVTGPRAMEIIEELERKYEIDLAPLVIKIMIKDIMIVELDKHLSLKFGIPEKKAKSLIEDLKNTLFKDVKDYLCINKEETVFTENHEIKKFVEDKEKKKVNSIHSEIGEKEKTSTSSSGDSANFFFSAEDEEEIRDLSEKIDLREVNSHTENIDDKLNKLAKELSINFSSEILKERFRKILSTYLRGVRNRIDTKLTMMKTVKEGGLGLDGDQTFKILSKAEVCKENISGEAKIVNAIPEKFKTEELVRDVEYDISSFEKEKSDDNSQQLAPPPLSISSSKILEKKSPFVETNNINSVDKNVDNTEESDNIVGDLDLTHELAPPPPKVAMVEDSKSKEKSEEKIREENKLKEEFLKNNQLTRKIKEVAGKKKVEDVKHVPHAMGPIDELGFMNFTNFRRLSSNPVKAVEKIKEKIKLLEEEHYGKKLEGIKAWRKSPINKMYLEIGQTAMEQNKSIEDCLKERKNDPKKYLSKEEFDAIMDLNKALRF